MQKMIFKLLTDAQTRNNAIEQIKPAAVLGSPWNT